MISLILKINGVVYSLLSHPLNVKGENYGTKTQCSTFEEAEAIITSSSTRTIYCIELQVKARFITVRISTRP